MECNKEEALRAKGIAEKKMQNQDFSGALKVAIKAQQLFQELENISQMIMVCDVHCAAEKPLFGNEKDWYAILKVEPTADEATIKKQYRKFALQLHPDKNKFPGAEAAFKLIGDAQRTLLDQGKRSAHDMKRRVTVNRPAPAAACRPPQNPSWHPYPAAQNNFHTNFSGMNSQQQRQPTQAGVSNGQRTFWTKCPYCTVRYQYYTEVLNRSLRCQACHKNFVAYDSGAVPQASNMTQSNLPRQGVAHNQNASRVDPGTQRKFNSESVFTSFTPKAAGTSDARTEKVNGKRGRKQTVESSESCDSESSLESEEDEVIDGNGEVLSKKKFDSQGEQNVRRSERRKQHVSYKENLSDDEDTVNPPKRAKGSELPSETEETGNEDEAKNHKVGKRFEASQSNGKKESGKGDDLKKTREASADGVKGNSNPTIDDPVSDTSCKETKESEVFAYPDPEFNDFDKEKKEGCFAVGQIWALYDTQDAMPRFYARIRKVFYSGFKVRITWLEPDPDDENAVRWVSEGLPVSCGRFKHGEPESIEDRLMFSHLISWEKGPYRDTYKIYPRKGEVWALFKNWNVNWKSRTEKHGYEFVEILSENGEGVGIHVAYLTKVKGFVSVFCPMSKDGVNTILIPPNELLRFSHKVPSFVLTGKERKGVPKGSFELDPASLPEEVFVPKGLKEEGDGRDPSVSEMEDPMAGSNDPDPSTSAPKSFEIPESEFYDFDADKTEEKFRVGQIWALYGDEDGLPKYYGEIKKVESSPVFKVHVRWLFSCPLETTTQWQDSDMPTCCGRFGIRRGSQTYTSTDSFSHLLKAEPTDTKGKYNIIPRKGEVWGLYRNWTPNIKCSDLENWEYDIVQVLEETYFLIKVVVLDRVEGFNSVFKPRVKGGSNVTIEIPRVDQIRFSHQIPYFQLTHERKGSLRGCLELDPAALPPHYFSF
ncbi:hypothetical protein E1A91_D02G062700v1 [Gossypium mustelinum]|uniref:J domain-containing protein n=1 Tax=Gossypium mustelinum TaxID=34275 RepID=A0A5D2VT63_GOSMU|nr:hypothetical protein E1A91_D02G062700v1 [Gossypium mustelinum]